MWSVCPFTVLLIIQVSETSEAAGVSWKDEFHQDWIGNTERSSTHSRQTSQNGPPLILQFRKSLTRRRSYSELFHNEVELVDSCEYTKHLPQERRGCPGLVAGQKDTTGWVWERLLLGWPWELSMRGSRPALLTFSMSCDLMYSVLWVRQFITTLNLPCSGDSWNFYQGGEGGEEACCLNH